MKYTDLSGLAEHMIFGECNTWDEFKKVAELKEGSTWKDVVAAANNSGAGKSYEQTQALKTTALQIHVASTSICPADDI